MKQVLKIFLIINLIFLSYNFIYSQEIEEFPTEEIIIDEKSKTINQEEKKEEEFAIPQKRIFLQIGAIESKNGNKFILRKKASKLEFFVEDNITSVFLKEVAGPQNIENNNLLIIKGPNNKKAVLANAVYIYKNKDLYNEYINKIDEERNSKYKEISGVVLNSKDKFEKIDENLEPVLLNLPDNEKILLFYDDDTYWVMIKKINYFDINAGDRVVLYFDKRISLRIKNIPFKIIVNRIAVGY